MKMKTAVFRYAVLGLAAMALTSSAFATTETFSDSISYSGLLGLGRHLDSLGIVGSKSLSGEFDLTSDGFAPGTDIALSGDASFEIDNLVNGIFLKNKMKISLDGITEYNSTINQGVQSFDFSFDDTGSGITILADVNADGLLDFTINATRGDFFVTEADLNVLATVPDPVTAPDGGVTILLFGAGLIGLAAAARKFRRKS
jgi:hypothetical protein